MVQYFVSLLACPPSYMATQSLSSLSTHIPSGNLKTKAEKGLKCSIGNEISQPDAVITSLVHSAKILCCTAVSYDIITNKPQPVDNFRKYKMPFHFSQFTYPQCRIHTSSNRFVCQRTSFKIKVKSKYFPTIL